MSRGYERGDQEKVVILTLRNVSSVYGKVKNIPITEKYGVARFNHFNLKQEPIFNIEVNGSGRLDIHNVVIDRDKATQDVTRKDRVMVIAYEDDYEHALDTMKDYYVSQMSNHLVFMQEQLDGSRETLANVDTLFKIRKG
tara:strand:+ start:134 stop:553 length:420 start_codon:yes stop_codon:yes gene_type:complete